MQAPNKEPAVGIEPTTARAQSSERSEREGVETGPEGDDSGESSPLNDRNATPKPDPSRLSLDVPPIVTRFNLEDAGAFIEPVASIDSGEPLEDMPQSYEEDYLAIDGHIYPNRPLAKVLAAVLAEVSRQAASGPHSHWDPKHCGPRVYRAAAAILEEMRCNAGGAA